VTKPSPARGLWERMGDRGVDRVVRDARAKGTELGRAARTKGVEIGRNMKQLDVPWARCGFARTLREAILSVVLGPLIDYYTRPRTFGRERFKRLRPPVVLVANHSSHLDTPTILRALPRAWRQRTAVAAAADYYFYKRRAVANVVALIFNTVPIQRKGGGIGGGATEHVDHLIDQRWNLLVFPEGTRSRDGRIGRLRSGAAAIAAQHGISIVPIFVKGTHEAMPPGRNWPKRLQGRFLSRRHKVEVHFGEPIRVREGESRTEVMERVRAFFESEAGAREQRDPIPVRRDADSAATPREPLSPAA
jgi:1-acyl-sn-glycerol-3-phosphate acyltransferase